jgi:thiamine-phosphate pyrophosphorylase
MPELFLIAPPEAEPASFAVALAALLGRAGARALLLPRAGRDADGYGRLVAAALPVAQGKDVAVLIEGEPADVPRLGADGLHVQGSLAAVRTALGALKPDFIVGAAAGTRHDAMDKAEAGVDYVFFGPLSGRIDAGARELARWWAEPMQVPAVLSDPEAGLAEDAEGCEFLAVGGGLWEPAE